jgi:O-antigen ligase
VKWVGLILMLAAIVPLTRWLRRNPGATEKAYMLMGFLPWVLDYHLFMAFISQVDWPGYVTGTEITVLDTLTLAVYFALPRTRHPLPFRISMAFYFFAVLLSVFQARYAWMAALFYPWQLARIFLFYATVARACACDSRAVPALMKGMVAGLFLEAGVVIWERFGLGILQAGGTQVHQNMLGMMSQFVIFPLFALLLAREGGWLPTVGTLAGLVVQVLTVSRATVGLGVFGFAAVFLLSIARQWTSRKVAVFLIGIATVAALTPMVISSFERRFAAEDFGTYDERAALETMSSMILSDHPLGVGANNFVITAIVDGYSEKAGVIPSSRLAIVHNVYWLVAAETGYLGLATFVILLLRPMIVAFVCGWRHRGDARGDLLLGLGVMLLTVYIHSLFEWLLVNREAQYMLALALGLIAGLAQQLGYWRRPATGLKNMHMAISGVSA